jgi:hypothetical protein
MQDNHTFSLFSASQIPLALLFAFSTESPAGLQTSKWTPDETDIVRERRPCQCRTTCRNWEMEKINKFLSAGTNYLG